MTDTSAFQENLGALRLDSGLVDALRAHRPTGEVSTGGDPGAPMLLYRGQSIYPISDPIVSVEREVAAMQDGIALDLVVLFGFGLGLHASAIHRKYRAPMIVFDPSLDLLRAGLAFGPCTVPDLTVVHRETDLLAAIENAAYLTDRRILAGAVPAYQQLFPDAFERFKQTFKAAVDTLNVRDNTLAVRGDVWSRYAVENLPRITGMTSLASLGGGLSGVPGIIVGTGPSLDRNIALLKGAAGRALVCACNSAVKPLSRAGIVPDMAAVIESNDQSVNFEENPHLDQMVLALSPDTHPRHFDVPARRHVTIAHLGSPAGDWLNAAFGDVQLPNGGSVACTGMALLHYLGCDPIILVGMDSAFTDIQAHSGLADQGRTLRHVYKEAEGVLERYAAGQETPVRVFTVQKVPAWGGSGAVLTYDGFTIYRNWFESAACSWAAERRLINATEGGARYLGFEEMSLREVLDTLCVTDHRVRERLDRLVSDAPAPDPGALWAVVDGEKAVLRAIGRQARRAAVSAKKARACLERGKLGAARKEIAALEKQERRLGAESRKSRLLNQYIGPKARAERLRRHDDKSDDPVVQTINALRRSASLFSLLVEGTEDLLQMFEPGGGE